MRPWIKRRKYNTPECDLADTISSVRGRIIYDSRSRPTIEVDIRAGSHTGRAAAPSGASVGKHEAVSFPLGGPRKSLDILEDNAGDLLGTDPGDHAAIGQILSDMDGTTNYSRIGGALAYAVSVAAAESAALARGDPLYSVISKQDSYRMPIPLGNVLGGGAHAGCRAPDIQEILVCAPGVRSAREAIQTNIDIHNRVGDLLAEQSWFAGGRGDEGGWAPNMNNEEALEVVARACESLGYTLGKEVSMGVDFASSTQYDADVDRYVYERAGFTNDPGEQVEFVSDIIARYKLAYAEDAVHEEAFSDMAEITGRFPDVLVTGDDLTVTNHTILDRAIQEGSCNAAILKINQAGSLHDALLFARKAKDSGIKLVTSHRSGESTGSHIIHVGVATNSVMLKVGVVGGERVAKLNEMIRITGHDLILGMAEV